jgi:hypothetical protein
MRCPSLLLLQPAWMELFCIWRRQLCSHTAEYPFTHHARLWSIIGAFSKPNIPDPSSLSGLATVLLRACFQSSPRRLIELCATCWLHSSYWPCFR